jgi:hypothetical protein
MQRNYVPRKLTRLPTGQQASAVVAVVARVTAVAAFATLIVVTAGAAEGAVRLVRFPVV